MHMYFTNLHCTLHVCFHHCKHLHEMIGTCITNCLTLTVWSRYCKLIHMCIQAFTSFFINIYKFYCMILGIVIGAGLHTSKILIWVSNFYGDACSLVSSPTLNNDLQIYHEGKHYENWNKIICIIEWFVYDSVGTQWTHHKNSSSNKPTDRASV